MQLLQWMCLWSLRRGGGSQRTLRHSLITKQPSLNQRVLLQMSQINLKFKFAKVLCAMTVRRIRMWLMMKIWTTMPRNLWEIRASTRLVNRHNWYKLRLRSQLNKSPQQTWTLRMTRSSIGASQKNQRSVRWKLQRRSRRNTSASPKYSGYLSSLRINCSETLLAVHSASQKRLHKERAFESSLTLRHPIEKKTLNFASGS